MLSFERRPFADHADQTEANGMNVLDTLQNNWGTPMPVQDNAAPSLDTDADTGPGQECFIDYPGYDPDRPGCSCECAGRTLMGRVSTDIQRDVERLKELMRLYPIRPHLHEGGGSGFSYPYSGWEHKDEIIKEFSELWFTAAGDLFITQYYQYMRIIAGKDMGKTVQYQPWKAQADRVGTSGASGSQGSGQA
jgi:hypothetical protein